MKNLMHKASLTHKELNSIVDHINNLSDDHKANQLVKDFNARLKDDPISIDEDHFKKAFNFLYGKHINKKGFILDNSPFTETKDIVVLSNLVDIQVVKLHNAGTIFKRFYIFQYKAIAPDDLNFQYFVFNNQVQIIKE
jgi:hypothetical protein